MRWHVTGISDKAAGGFKMESNIVFPMTRTRMKPITPSLGTQGCRATGEGAEGCSR